ncbi:UDP-N-acetylmuramate dehydrogenase [Coraliomargarita parva]|uniref:UDP-N-acetylmuramate dehydrogenase n=1 Tax=Coraliomargarita parva TaxID=3014050 RepID=UPI0022B5366F|nr:UDP-N-acetylmuramate dehydrogenase [Coraliomargarita parva]
MSGDSQRYLFLGVGGMGMAPLAAWMARSGYSISGYDDYLREPVRAFLEDAGVGLADLCLPEHVSAHDVVVYSSAIRSGHRLLEAARSAGLRCVRRGRMLAEIASRKRLIAVVGSHGKTTTSGMIAHAIHQADLPADFILGGFFSGAGPAPARATGSDWLVAEVDESDGTIDAFCPEVTLLLNIDWDHPDQYEDPNRIESAFGALLRRTRGTVLLPSTGNFSAGLLDGVQARVRTYGEAGEYAVCTSPKGTLELSGAFPSCSVGAPTAGRFNQSNGAAALSVLAQIGKSFPEDCLSSFRGMARRQTTLLEEEGLVLIEDYAHHPSEINALLDSLRLRWPAHRQVVVFQPHRYSRTRAFKDAFAQSLGTADALYLLPVYAAHECDEAGGRTLDLAAAFSEPPCCLEMNLQGLRTLREAAQGDATLLAFVGAGDIGEYAGVYKSMVRQEWDPAAAWLDYLKPRVSPQCLLKLNEPLAGKTTMRVGGASRFYAEPACLSDLRALLESARFFGLPVFSLGRGSNLVVPDEGYDGLVLRLNGGIWRQVSFLPDGRVWAGAGVRLKEICGHAAKAGLSGFEFLEGIPGAVGGALRMNAGAMGNWMFDVVERVQYLDGDGRLLDAPKEAFHFGYRKVEEISRGIALGAILKAPELEDEAAIRNRMDSYAGSRKESQPRAPSAGCIFKNPEGNYAGKLIDELGIKGLSVGAAEVSTVHGNFIVNNGGATAADIIELVRQVRERVKHRSGYVLEPEVLLLGKSWDEVLNEEETASNG